VSTGTSSTTFTRTNARHIGSKIAADLRQMNNFYDQPALSAIDAFYDEIVELLARKWVKTVDYGFWKDGAWILSLRYEVRDDGTIADTGTGRVHPNADVTGASFYSFLSYSSKFFDEDHANVIDSLPVKRTYGDEPSHTGGYWESGKSYASGGVGAVRTQWRPL
jgi:hypothetical protein